MINQVVESGIGRVVGMSWCVPRSTSGARGRNEGRSEAARVDHVVVRIIGVTEVMPVARSIVIPSFWAAGFFFNGGFLYWFWSSGGLLGNRSWVGNRRGFSLRAG